VRSWTPAIRMVWSVGLGALAGCLLWVFVGYVVWHAGLGHVDPWDMLFTNAAMLGFTAVGALVGLALRMRRRRHRDCD